MAREKETIKTFEDLPLSDALRHSLTDKFQFTELTKIQRETIPILMDGKDIMVTAKTGSGKTLAFLLPLLEQLLRQGGTKPSDGTVAIIIAPTRELADQIYYQLDLLTIYCKSTLSIACLKGGTKKKDDVMVLKKGISILVCTPGRLLDHLRTTQQFCWANVKFLVLDEADQLLDHGFEDQIKSIVRLLPKKRQTMMFSATLNEKTQQLATVVLKTDCAFHRSSEDYVDDSVAQRDHKNDDNDNEGDHNEAATVLTLKQFYVFYETPHKFVMLYRLLKTCHKKNYKVMVFMASCAEVKFYYELLNMVCIHVEAIHGNKKQAARTKAYNSFLDGKVNILLCTDVAARGLDFPSVNWIIQYDAPNDAKGYIHRVGRTARAGKSGHALLLLRQSERNFLQELRTVHVSLKPTCLRSTSDAALEKDLKNILKVVQNNRWLLQSATEGYRSYLRSYTSYNINCFDTRRLSLPDVATSFGLAVAPFVELNVAVMRASEKRKMKGNGPHKNAKRQRPV